MKLVKILREIAAEIEELKGRTDITPIEKERLAYGAALSLPDRVKEAFPEPSEEPGELK